MELSNDSAEIEKIKLEIALLRRKYLRVKPSLFIYLLDSRESGLEI